MRFDPGSLVWGLVSKDMGIDLGTANTLVYIKGEGIVLNEPSVVTVREGTNEVMETDDGDAVGNRAKDMLGKTPGKYRAIRPMKNGVIADADITEKMIRYFIRKVHGRKSFFGPRLVIAVPYGITNVEERAVRNSGLRAGARAVYRIEEPMAAAIGAGLPVTEPKASMIVDIGGGTTEVAIISLGAIVTATSIRIAGDHYDESIAKFIKDKYNLNIGPQTAENIKIHLGSLMPLPQEMEMEVRGQDTVSGLPRTQMITSEEIRDAMTPPASKVVDAIRETLTKAPPELSADLVSTGVVLSGGGSLIRGISAFIAERCGIKVSVAEDPLKCVAKGTGMYLENIEKWSKHLDHGVDEQ
ncbi:MAG: rod shape-determining protein [Planctomycetota bacterium]